MGRGTLFPTMAAATGPEAPAADPRWMRRHPIVAGLLIGIAWGVAMRLWMRFITTTPEFSWSGTLFIIGASAIVGTLLGFARLRRWKGGVGWWRFSAVSLLLLGAGGAVMWPSVILGAIAYGRRRTRWLAGLLGLAAIGAQIPVLSDAVLENFRLNGWEKLAAMAWYLPLLSLEAWAFSISFEPSLRTVKSPRRLKAALIGVPMAAFALVALLSRGFEM